MSSRIKGFWAHRNAHIDNHSQFSEHNHIYGGSTIIESALGRFTYVNGAHINNSDVGAFCSIGPNVRIGGLGIHPTKYLSTHPVFYSPLKQAGISFTETSTFDERPRTNIGNDVWIGANALILDGINVGNGAIIAAGAVVTKDVAPFSIVGGVPAKLIRARFNDEVIEALQDWQWWTLPMEQLDQYHEDFTQKEDWRLADITHIQQKMAKNS